MGQRVWRRLPFLVPLLWLVVLALPGPTAAAPLSTGLDFPLTRGWFFGQTGGTPDGRAGFSLTDADNIPFWTTFQALGGVRTLGYPVSRRFVWDGFVTQVLQKAVFQWRPEVGQVYFLNTFDDLSRHGFDDWLYVYRSTPRPLPPDFDAGLSWAEIVQKRLALLNARPAIRARYFAVPDPLRLYGLPTSPVEDMGNHYAIRLQRAVIQEWKVDVPWARRGETTVANGGDLAKEAGLFPTAAIQPELSPRAPAATARVTANLAEVRTAPDEDAPLLARLLRNLPVRVTGERQVGAARWLEIDLWNALRGWVLASQVDFSPYPAVSPPASRTIGSWPPPAPRQPAPRSLNAPARVVTPASLHATPAGPVVGQVPAGQTGTVIEWTARDDQGWYLLAADDQRGWIRAEAVVLIEEDPLTRWVGGRPIQAPIAGKGLWVKYDTLQRTTPQVLVQAARANGLRHLYFQVARSPQGFYGAEGLNALLPVAHQAGLAVIAWVYPYLHDLALDLDLAYMVATYRTPGGEMVDGLAADIEQNMAPAAVRAYGQILRALLGPDRLLVAVTYPPESYHGQRYPWTEVARSWNAIAPMDYYRRPGQRYREADAYQYVARSIALIRQRTGRPDHPIAVIGPAYDPAYGNNVGPNNPTAAEIRGVLRAARDHGALGASFFEWSRLTPEEWQALGAFSW